MLYKVTPMLTPVDKDKTARAKNDPAAPKDVRKRRRSAVYDADGNEVLITMMCLKCRTMKPLGMFGLRKMADGAIRNQPWCRTCRSGAGVKKKDEVEAEAPAAGAAQVTAPEPEVHDEEPLEASAPVEAPVEPAPV